MPVYKEKDRNTWFVSYRYTDWTGKVKQTNKRGFLTKKSAVAWEREVANQLNFCLDMTLEDFFEIYANDIRNRIKENTWQTKEYVVKTKILPYLGKRKMNDIKPKDIFAWQNEMFKGVNRAGNRYSPVYLKTIHNQLSAIFNHAVRFYDLKSNPAAKVGNMGKSKYKEMLFWTLEEYQKFSFQVMDKPIIFYAFEMLYWTGIREGELLALTPSDFNFEKETVSITKSYQRINGKDLITDPKTPKSNRVVKLPSFLSKNMQEFITTFYTVDENDRIFTISKSCLTREMTRGAELAEVKRIRIHDLRHSHVSLLINMGYSALAIADRVGHESIEITYQYAHLFPTTQGNIANDLNELRKGVV